MQIISYNIGNYLVQKYLAVENAYFAVFDCDIFLFLVPRSWPQFQYNKALIVSTNGLWKLGLAFLLSFDRLLLVPRSLTLFFNRETFAVV